MSRHTSRPRCPGLPGRIRLPWPPSAPAVVTSTISVAVPFVAAVAWLGIGLLGCQSAEDGPTAEKFVETREVMGTLATITVIAEGGRDAVSPMEAAFAALDSVNARMSAYQTESDIGRLNRAGAAERVVVDPATFEVLEYARQCGELSGGAFDITVGPLIGLWREAAGRDQPPTEEELATVLACVGLKHLGTDPDRREVWFLRDGMRIDLGGIAKGYGIDRAVAALQAEGIEAGIVEVGGDLRCFGRIPQGLIGKQAALPVRTLRRKSPGPVGSSQEAQPPEGFFPGLRRTDAAPLTPRRPWPLGIQSPFAEELLGKIVLSEGAVATSGHYRRYTSVAGQRYSHILDPRTGLPVEDPASVTVIADDALTADALATTISVLGTHDGMVLADSLPGVEAAIVEGTAEQPIIHRSAGFPKIKAVAEP